jgi:hypothetical protein
MADIRPQPATALDIALSYIARGWNPVPVPHRAKKPVDDEWQLRVIDAGNAPQLFNGGRQNIGVILGPSSHGLTDIDLDCAEAIAIAPYVLPRTAARFGRPSKRESHRLYYTDLALLADKAVINFNDPRRAATQAREARMLELRIGGDKGAQTIFPGSTHEQGEPIAWEEDGEPASVEGEDLQQRVRALAAYALLARYWPGQGARHEAALVLGGFLSRAGKTAAAVKVAAEAIARAAGDEEWRDRRKAAEDAANAHRNGEKAYGLNKLREMLGTDIADKIADWLDYRGGDEQPFEEHTNNQEQEPEPGHEPEQTLIQSSAQFTASYVPPDYLIDGFLQRRYCYALTARTGTGKTALALLLAALVALGKPLGDRQIDQGRVLIFAGENPDDIRARWIAMGQQMQFDVDTIDVHFIPGRFKITQLINRIREEVLALGGVALLIIDTSAAFFEGDDENSNVQLGAHAARMRELRIPGGPCTLINCHPTKNATDDNLLPRGAGAFLAEVDGNLTASKNDMTVELHWQGKFRGPDFAPMHFLLKTVTHERLKDTKGRLISTVVASHLSDAAQQELAKIARSTRTWPSRRSAKTPAHPSQTSPRTSTGSPQRANHTSQRSSAPSHGSRKTA